MEKTAWHILFGETSAFRKRYIRFEGTRDECSRQMSFWRFGSLVSAVMSEKDFLAGGYLEKGYKEIEIED